MVNGSRLSRRDVAAREESETLQDRNKMKHHRYPISFRRFSFFFLTCVCVLYVCVDFLAWVALGLSFEPQPRGSGFACGSERGKRSSVPQRNAK